MNASPLISRRSFLVTGVTAGAVLASGVGIGRARPRGLDPAPAPFSLGVASGEPGPHRVVLWTRLAWDPLHGGGIPAAPVPEGQPGRALDHYKRAWAIAQPVTKR